MHAVDPSQEIFFRVNNYSEPHVRVGDAAELCALSVERANFATSHPQVVIVQGNHVDLAGDFRYPEAVDNVFRCQFETNRATYGYVEFVRSYDFVIRVPELKPPLVTNGFNT